MIHHITINGESHPFTFNMVALVNTEESIGKSVQEIFSLGDKIPLSYAIRMVYHGLKEGYRKTKKDFDLEWEDVAEMIESDLDGFTKAMERIAHDASAATEPISKKKAPAASRKRTSR
jgi:hypothetical protein